MAIHNGRPTLLVDERPFFYNGVQFSLQRLVGRDGWNWADLDAVFAAAAESGYTVIGMPLLWNRIETEPGYYDWTDIEAGLAASARHGLRLEFLWFGSQICSVSRPSHGTPEFAVATYDLVRDANGVALSAPPTDRVMDGDVKLVKLDICDGRLLAAECHALGRAVAQAGAITRAAGYPTLLIGVQLLNEPTAVRLWGNAAAPLRSHSPSAEQRWRARIWPDAAEFNTVQLLSYLNALGQAVRDSGYRVWTRVNLYSALEGVDRAARLMELNETARAAGASAIDFIGDDVYSRDPETIYRYCTDSEYGQGDNLVMVMENGGHYPNGDQLMINALAGDGRYHVWEICDTMPEWPAGLYTCETEPRRLIPKRHQPVVAAANRLVRDLGHLLATESIRSGRLAVINREFAAHARVNAAVGDWGITFESDDPGAAIAGATQDGLVLGATSRATFTLPGAGNGTVHAGRYDADRWVDGAPVEHTLVGQDLRVTAEAGCCIRVARGRTIGRGDGSAGFTSIF